MKNNIKSKLEKQAKKFTFNKKKEALIVALAKENDVHIPESLIMYSFNQEYESVFKNYQIPKEEVEKLSYALYEASVPKITVKLQSQFIIEALLKKYEIKVDDEGIQEFLKTLSEETEAPMDMLQSFLSDPEKKEAIIEHAEERKLFDILYAKSTFEEDEKLSLNTYIEKNEALGA